MSRPSRFLFIFVVTTALASTSAHAGCLSYFEASENTRTSRQADPPARKTLTLKTPRTVELPSSKENARIPEYVKDTLSRTDSYRVLVDKAEEKSNSWLNQPYFIRAGERDLGILPSAYKSARFAVRENPIQIPEGATLVRHIKFGYALEEARTIGVLNYIVFDKNGKAFEVGAGSDEALREFRNHTFGRVMSERELKTIETINTQIFETLQSDPTAQAKVQAFEKKRGWDTGLATKAKLAYFDPSILNPKRWAKEHGYTFEQIRDAGWLQMRIEDEGTAFSRVNYPDSIKIPFFSGSQKSQIPVWRTRVLVDRGDGKKYLGWQNDRSTMRPWDVKENLYNAWELDRARDKTVVITEGEFKCLVAQDKTGIITVGIPGISQFDSKISRALVDSGASDFIVILDRDPLGKGLMRIDGITDSQRAAYTIAKQLEASGAKKVRIGVLPDAFEGGKVGIDDLILDRGTAPYLETLKNAADAETYARAIGLDPVLQELNLRKQALLKTRDHYDAALRRGVELLNPAELKTLEENLARLRETFRQYMASRHKGETSFATPSSTYGHIDTGPNGPDSLPLRLIERGKPVKAQIGGDVLTMDYIFKDRDVRVCRPRPCVKFGLDSLSFAKVRKGESNDSDLTQVWNKGVALAKENGVETSTARGATQALLAGSLLKTFPPDEFTFVFNSSFTRFTNSSNDVVAVLVLKKNNNSVVTLAQLRVPGEEDRSAANFARIGQTLRQRPSRQ